MHAILDTQTREVVTRGKLPIRFTLPDGGVTLFEKTGQIEPAHAPRFRAIESLIVTPKPDIPTVVVGETAAVVDGREEVTRTYALDQSAYQRAIEARIETVAAERQYSSAVSIASYVASTIPQWRAEAEAFVAWRDAVWSYALGELTKAQQGGREPPGLDAFMAELPAIEWPAKVTA